jgi:predicted AAA+ superfamily ATPase
MLNLFDLDRDADVAVNTAKSWLSILQASFEVALLPPYHSNLMKRLMKAPKLYFLDTGLCADLTEWSSRETLAAGAMSGAMLETLVFPEVLRRWWNRGEQPRPYYYRDKEHRKIDLLIVQSRTVHPVDVKKSSSPPPEWAGHCPAPTRMGLKVGDGAVICLGREVLSIHRGVTAIPLGLL